MALLWGLINTLQIVAHFPLFQVVYPENAKIVLETFLEIATMDLMPDEVKDSIKEEILQVESREDQAAVIDSELSNSVKSAGFESSSQLENNFMQILMLVASSILLLVALLFFLLCKKSAKCRACLEALKRKLIWNYFIRLTLETALEVLIASMIRTYTLNFD